MDNWILIAKEFQRKLETGEGLAQQYTADEPEIDATESHKFVEKIRSIDYDLSEGPGHQLPRLENGDSVMIFSDNEQDSALAKNRVSVHLATLRGRGDMHRFRTKRIGPAVFEIERLS